MERLVTSSEVEFRPFSKIARLSREIIITEKLDGTNASITIDEDGEFRTGSKNRWITPEDDNYGFAKWAQANKPELMKLGVGRHFGEWWGQGIQRNYSQPRKHFSLFNVHRWGDPMLRPMCCDVVPTLYIGPMEEYGVMKGVKHALMLLAEGGSVAAPGFMKPEGIIIYHVASGYLFKKTLEKDEEPKGKAAA
jgi:hypothetical protein